jgi:LysM repeat protein
MKRALAVGLCLLLLALPVSGDTFHVVEAGETLYSIARRYGVKLDDLLEDNGIDGQAVTKVRVGTKLTIKGPASQAPQSPPAEAPRSYATHVVAKDETLWSIARRYGATVDEIKAANPAVDASKLYVGARLRVPVEEPKASAPAAIPAAPAPPKVAVPVTPPAAEGLWPHPGAREPSTDGHFKYTRISGKIGDQVTAVSSGRVTWVSPYRLYRNVVIIETRTPKSGDAYWFFYAGIDDVYVRAGDWVEKGATIARLGADGTDGKGQVLFAVYQGTQVVEHTRTVWQ